LITCLASIEWVSPAVRARLGREDAVAAEGTFLEVMQRVRAGDETAALELHATYADQLQRIIRVRLTQPALRRQMDSIDICQSVFADFFVRTALGQYDLQSPTELIKLLATMARNRLIYHAQKQRAARRDIRRVEAGAVEDFALPGGEGSGRLERQYRRVRRTVQ
jgi:DNA-directed RNA polymerase specialized sigma24 family protein